MRLTAPKRVLINRPKIPQMPQNLSAQAQKFGISMKKGFIGRPLSMPSLIEKKIFKTYLMRSANEVQVMPI